MNRDAWKTVFGVLLVLGSLGWAIAAAVGNMQPATTLIELQSQWMDGRYYVKLTFLLTWLVLLTPGAALALVLSAATNLASRATPPPDLTNPSRWSVLHQSSQRRALLPSLLATVFGVGYCALALTSPESLAPGGALSALGLLVAFLATLVGTVLFFDALLPACWHLGTVRDLRVQPGQNKAPPRYFIVLERRSFDVPEAVFHQLRVGYSVAVLHGAALDRLFDLRIQLPGLR